MTDTTYLILHALRIRGLLDADGLSVTTGVDAEEIAPLLDALVEDGALKLREGRLSGYQLTPEGKERHAAALEAERSGIDLERLADADASFVRVNGPFKELCTEWQTSENRDRAATGARLHEIHGDALEAVAVAASTADRFSTYALRLDASLARFDGGDDTAFLRPMADSYHDVWMELHQDLLVTMGRERAVADGH